MPNLDDKIEDLESSTDPNLDEQTQQPSAVEPVDAKSSTATGENDESALLSVVRDVVKDRNADDTSAASPAAGEEDGDAKPKKQDDENYSDVPFSAHPRFKQLLREKNAYREDAGRYYNVVNFLDEAGLTDAEAADGLKIMGMAKTNPAEAWKSIKPWVQKLLVAAGEVLPDDLRQRVASGEFSQEAAMEISRARASAESVQASQTFRDQLAQRRQATGLVNEIKGAANSWEQDRRRKDPNFDAKFVPLQKEVAWLIQQEGRPTTPEGVKDQLTRAYKIVNEQFRPANPTPARKPAIRPVTGGQVAGGQQPNAKDMSTLDIIRANRKAG